MPRKKTKGPDNPPPDGREQHMAVSWTATDARKLARAARLEGRSVTEFVTYHALLSAEVILAQHQKLRGRGRKRTRRLLGNDEP